MEPKQFTRLWLAALIIQVVATPAPAADEANLTLPVVAVVSQSTNEGRRVVRYEHASLPQWHYAQPQRDYFYLFYPEHPTSGHAPLRVILHSAGGSGESESLPNLKPDRARFIQACVAESDYGLYLDCRGNQATDWWWGYQTLAKEPNRYATELCPTEKRVLATVNWVIHNFPVDRNRVYLSGISMGGSGSLGLGLAHGEIFAAISVVVPAGADHALFRLRNGPHQDPPPVCDFSAQNDNYSRGQEQLIAYCQTNRYALTFAWGPIGHVADVSACNPAVYEFPWLSIRKDEAYPVFTGASTDNIYPGLQNLTAPDQWGQINGYFRWKTLTDTPGRFAMELRLVTKTELHKPVELPRTARSDVTLRRLQRFQVTPGRSYQWRVVTRGERLQSGRVRADANGLLTIPQVALADTPRQLQVEPD